MKFIDFFAGIGGFRRGLELAGHKCVGFCEWDKYATASYTSMHLITDKQREYLNALTLKQRQKEILKDEYRNGEWYSDDIRTVDARSLPKADCWTFGAPCQDFSVAGKRAGLDGDRSSLVQEIFRLLEEQEEKDRPEWIIYENVKGMLSSNRGLDYLSILSEMDRLGYDIEWQNINSKWFVPQNRERIYTIGHLRRYGSKKILPVTGTDGENSVSIIDHRDEYRRNTQTFSPGGITETLDTGQGGGREHHVGIPCFCDMNYKAGLKTTDSARTIQARYNKGVCNRSGEVSGVVIPVLTPVRAEKRQNGRRFKENGDPMFTLTSQDRHGIAINVKEATPKSGS
jgi:DNA (cytosine-5)-methyltransferase 1